MKNLAVLVVLAATSTAAFAQGDLKTETKTEKKTEMAANGTTKTTRKTTHAAKGNHPHKTRVVKKTM